MKQHNFENKKIMCSDKIPILVLYFSYGSQEFSF